MWIVYACLGSVTAAIVAILAKTGIQNVNSNLGTAIITSVVFVMSWGAAFATGAFGELATLPKKSLIFLLIAGFTTSLSWLFYYKALQTGPASKVVPIDKFSVVIAIILAFVILREPFTVKSIIGASLIGAGTLLMVLQ